MVVSLFAAAAVKYLAAKVTIAAAVKFVAGVALLNHLSVRARRKRPDAARAQNKTNVRAAISPARYIYGEARTGGVVAYIHQDSEHLWVVYALSKGPCDAITGLWVDGKRQTISPQMPSDTTEGSPLMVSEGKYNGRIFLWPCLKGDGSTDQPGAVRLRRVPKSEWTTTHAGGGVSYAVVQLTQHIHDNDNAGTFSGFPKLEFLVRGRKFVHPSTPNFDNLGKANPNYDPDQDESDSNPRLLPQPVAAWTDNAAACIYDYLRVRRGIPADEIDVQSFKDAFPVCEAQVANSRPDDRYLDWAATSKRYSVNGIVFADDDPDTMMSEFAFAIRGHVFEHNTRFRIVVGRNRAPGTVIWDGDILEGSMVTAPSNSERVNSATMEIEQSRYHEFQNYSAPKIADQFQIIRDGEVYEKNLGRRVLVNDPAQLDRLLYGALRRARSSGRLTLTLEPGRMLKWIAMPPTELCEITFDQLGLNRWRGELTSMQLNDDYSVTCTFDEIFSDEYSDDTGLGVIEGRRVNVPRVDDPPEQIAANDITAVVEPRAGGGGAILWKVTVTVPLSSYTFAATVRVGNLELTNSTNNNELEFDIDIFRQDMEVTVWRVNRRDLAGPTTTVGISPEYSRLTIPAVSYRTHEQLVGDMVLYLRDPNTPVVKGCEFRFTSETLDSGLTPGTLTDSTWSSAAVLDAQTLLFQPATDPIFKLTFTASGKYRIYGRFVDSHGRYGPVSELTYANVVIPKSTAFRFGGQPAWNGTLNNMGVFKFGNDDVLVPIPAGSLTSVTARQWDGFVTSSVGGTTSYRARWRVKGAADWGATVNIAGSASSHTITGLTNGLVYEVQLWRVDGSVEGPANTVDFKPTLNAAVPGKPFVSAAGRVRSVQVHSVVSEEDERALVTAHRYRIATSAAALATANWKTAPGTADHDVVFLVSGLVASTTYHLQTQAVNRVGNGAISDIVEVRTGGDISAGSWVRSDWDYTLYQLAVENVAKDQLVLFGAGDDGTPLRFPPSNIGESARGVILWFDDGDLKQVRLVSRLQAGNVWTAYYSARTRASGTGAWGAWSAWSTTIPAEYTVDNANDAISKGGYIITPSATENAPDLHRSDVDGQPVVLRVLRDSGGNATGQRIRYEHFGGQSYDRTVDVRNVQLGAPSAPTLTVTPRVYGNSVDLLGTVASDNGAVISLWEVRFASTLAALNTAEWSAADDRGGNTLNHQITNLTPGATYYFEVRATNEIGTSAGSGPVAATVSSVATYFGQGRGSSAEPYHIAPSDFVTARAIKREFDANNRTPYSYVISQAVTETGVVANIEFTAAANITGQIDLADGGGRSMSMKLYRDVTQIGAGTNRISWTAGTADTYRLLIFSAGSAAYDSGATLRVQIGAQSGDPAQDSGASAQSGASGPPARPPLRVKAVRAGATGARLTWASPGFSDAPPLHYELEWSDGADWRFMAETEGTSWTELSGVSGDAAWRVRAVYPDGESEWVEASIADLYSDGASLHAVAAVDYEVLTNNASAKLQWLGGAVGDVVNWWPFGEVEGHGLAFDSSASTYYETNVVDLGEDKQGSLDADFELFLPDATVVSASSLAEAQDARRGVAFQGDLPPQVWAVGPVAVPVPPAESEGGEIAYEAAGLPRGVRLSGGELTGSPAVIPGAVGVGRITARAESGADHSFFSWCAVAEMKRVSGDGTFAAPLEFQPGGFKGDIRPLLRPGSMNRADPSEDIPTWVAVRIPPGGEYDLRAESPPGQDFDLIHRGLFHDTGAAADVVRLENRTTRTVTEKVGIYRWAEAPDAEPNADGPPVTVSLAPAMPAGLALAAEWDALTGAGAAADNVAGAFDAEITAFTARQRPAGQPNAPLSWSEQAVVPGTRVQVEARYFRWRMHVKESRNRALRSTAFTFLELTT